MTTHELYEDSCSQLFAVCRIRPKLLKRTSQVKLYILPGLTLFGISENLLKRGIAHKFDW